MERLPLVYVILVNYNGLADTLECLESLYKSSYVRFKAVVVDNGSSQDPSPILWQNYPQAAVIKAEENRGFAAGCNIGIRYALTHGADYVLLLNNDTIIDYRAIEKLVMAMESHYEVGIMGGKIYYYNDPSRIWYAGGKISFPSARCIHFKYGKVDTGGEAEEIIYTDFVTGCMMMVRASLFHSIGTLNEAYFYGVEDMEFCWNAKRAGYKLAYVPSAKLFHKIGGSRTGVTAWYVANLFYSRGIFMRHVLGNELVWRFWLDFMGNLHRILWVARGQHSYARAITVAQNYARRGLRFGSEIPL